MKLTPEQKDILEDYARLETDTPGNIFIKIVVRETGWKIICSEVFEIQFRQTHIHKILIGMKGKSEFFKEQYVWSLCLGNGQHWKECSEICHSNWILKLMLQFLSVKYFF